MKKLQILAVLILSLFFVVSCVSDEDDDEDFCNNDQTDTAPDGNSDTTGDTLPNTPTEPTESTDPTVEPTTDPTTEPTTEPTTDPTTDPTNPTDPTTDPTTEPTTEPTTDPTTDPTNPTDPTDPTEPEQTPEEKCLAANGTWNANNTCTKTADCTEKPANTEWNDNGADGKFTQTLNGTTWTPASKAAAYGEGECGYKCIDDYFWNNAACVNPCNPDPCGSNAEPDSCEASDATTYTCGCVDGYHWENDGCADNTKTVYCTLPAHAHWNAGTTPTVEQSWTSNEGWPPSPEGVYDPERTDGCYFSCDDDSHWEEASGKCELNMPVCSSSNTSYPCIDSTTGYIWSQKFPAKTGTNAASDCSNLTAGGYNWRLPEIYELRTLIQNCSSTQMEGGTCNITKDCTSYNDTCRAGCSQCSTDSSGTGKYSKLGDAISLWSSTNTPEFGSGFVWTLNFRTATFSFDNMANGGPYQFRCVYVPENN